MKMKCDGSCQPLLVNFGGCIPGTTLSSFRIELDLLSKIDMLVDLVVTGFEYFQEFRKLSNELYANPMRLKLELMPPKLFISGQSDQRTRWVM